MATAADYLTLARDQAAQRLSELDTVPLDQRARMTYTADNGQTFDWNSYRQSLLTQIKELNTLIVQTAGPWTINEFR
ncbi:unnamed protein product [Gemmataceae bacterium]|nr:unnamed protein product [Gemmataceae bacterium]VTT98935.1 unnamed protein product [Gemmataceae bacterium]